MVSYPNCRKTSLIFFRGNFENGTLLLLSAACLLIFQTKVSISWALTYTPACASEPVLMAQLGTFFRIVHVIDDGDDRLGKNICRLRKVKRSAKMTQAAQ